MAFQKRQCALLLAIVLKLSAHALAQRSTINSCTSANEEYYLSSSPGSLWYYRGSGNDPYCVANPLLSQYVCGVRAAPACPQTKAQTCSVATYPADCNAAPRVFSVNLDADCDYVVVCEFLDTAGGTTTGGTVPVGGTTPAVTARPTPAVTELPGGVLPSGALAPTAPISTTLPIATRAPIVTLSPTTPVTTTAVSPATAGAPSLLPQPTDVVVTSAYAVGVVTYACSKTSTAFGNMSIKADLYSNSAIPSLAGSYVSGNGSQIFTLTSGAAQVIAVEGSYVTPSNVLKDGGYGSLNQTYYTATGTLGLADVTYITQTLTSGGVLPKNATCARTPFANVTLPPWQVPFQANYTFFSTFTPPI